MRKLVLLLSLLLFLVPLTVVAEEVIIAQQTVRDSLGDIGGDGSNYHRKAIKFNSTNLGYEKFLPTRMTLEISTEQGTPPGIDPRFVTVDGITGDPTSTYITGFGSQLNPSSSLNISSFHNITFGNSSVIDTTVTTEFFIELFVDETDTSLRRYLIGIDNTPRTTPDETWLILSGLHTDWRIADGLDSPRDQTVYYILYGEPQGFGLDWVGQSPLNGEVRADDPLVFNYDLSSIGDPANCTLYSNQTGTFDSSEDVGTSLTDGSHTLEYDAGINETRDLLFQIRCDDGTDEVNTTIKTIEIDTKNVVITYLNPASDGSDEYDENIGSIQVNIRYSNHNLDYVSYNVTDESGAIVLSNVSTTFVDPLNYEFNDTFSFLTTETGLYTITAYGNDTQGLEDTRQTTFRVLNNFMTLDWDAQTPTNGSAIVDQTVVSYNYDLNFGNVTSINCFFYDGDAQVTSASHTTSGIKSFNIGYDEVTSEAHNYKVNCTGLSGYLVAETSVKDITIENDLSQTLGLMTLIPLFTMLGAVVLIWRNRSGLLNLGK